MVIIIKTRLRSNHALKIFTNRYLLYKQYGPCFGGVRYVVRVALSGKGRRADSEVHNVCSESQV